MIKKLVICLLAPCVYLTAFEYEVQLDNEQMSIAKVTIAPGEVIGLHRDVRPALVIGLKGGTITRLEPNGTETKVDFPTGQAVWRPIDPFTEPHRSINTGHESVELLIIEFKTDITLAH